MVERIEELNRSPWSGHSGLMGYVKRDWQDTGYVLSFFGKRGSGKRRYLEFVKKGIDVGRRPELVGGGLIRSLGGWAEVLALRARGERQVSDQRVLGVCDVDGVSIGELRSGSRRREIVNARGVFSWLAVRELRYSGAEVARFLGVTTSCVTRAVSSGKEPKIKRYL